MPIKLLFSNINYIYKHPSLKQNMVKDSHVLQTMRYLELVKEMKKSGNKNKKVI